jgi:hypothetical protein
MKLAAVSASAFLHMLVQLFGQRCSTSVMVLLATEWEQAVVYCAAPRSPICLYFGTSLRCSLQESQCAARWRLSSEFLVMYCLQHLTCN